MRPKSPCVADAEACRAAGRLKISPSALPRLFVLQNALVIAFDVPDELKRWAKRAGYIAFRQIDPNTLLYNDSGGEIRRYIRLADDGWLVLTRADRAGPERFEIATASTAIMERYLWGQLGSEVRSVMRLPDIRYPLDPDDIAPGYRIGEDDEAGDLRTLFDPAGQPIVKVGGGFGSARSLVLVSNYLAAPLDALLHSFEDPEGKPLFTLSELQPPPGP
jgi:hypothetical protein